MSDTVEAPTKRRAPAAKAVKANQPTGWRQLTREFLQSLSAPLQAAHRVCGAEDIGMGTYLVGDLQRKVGTMYEQTHDAAVPRHSMLDEMGHLESLMCATQDLRDATDTLRAVLEGPQKAVARFANDVLDAGSRDDDLAGAKSSPSKIAPERTGVQKQSAVLFGEIAQSADAIRKMSITASLANGDAAEVDALVTGIEALASRVGLIADTGAIANDGGSASLAGADPAYWFLPPAYQAEGRAA